MFRKPKECKERHKVLMDKSAGDGADSAEDSGSSQPYSSTLPGIPKAGFSYLALYLSCICISLARSKLIVMIDNFFFFLNFNWLFFVLKQGSARQLFQRLQEPMEEDTLKSHFDKIIKIGKQHYRRTQVCEL